MTQKHSIHNEEVNDSVATEECNPRLADAYYKRGSVNLVLEKLNSAVEDFDRAIKLDPELAVAYFHRAQAREKLGDDIDLVRVDYKLAQKYGTDLAIPPEFL